MDELAKPPPTAAAPAPAVRRRWRRAPFPYVRQLDEMDCGVACLAMVCRHFGREVAPAHIRMSVGTGADGTSLRGIQRGGEHVGLEVRAVKASKDRVEQLPLPAIIHWGGNHWVVLYRVDGDRVDDRRSGPPPAPHRPRGAREELERLRGAPDAHAATGGGAARARECGLARRVRAPLPQPAAGGAGAGARRGRPGDALPGAHPAGVRSRPRAPQLLAAEHPHDRDARRPGALVARHDVPAPHARADRGRDRHRDARLHHRAPLRAADLLLRDAADRRHRTAPRWRPRDPRDARAGRDRGAHRRDPAARRAHHHVRLLVVDGADLRGGAPALPGADALLVAARRPDLRGVAGGAGALSLAPDRRHQGHLDRQGHGGRGGAPPRARRQRDARSAGGCSGRTSR